MAKTSPLKKTVEVSYKKIFTNFGRYKVEKRLSYLNGLIKGIVDRDVVPSLDDYNPGYIDPINPMYTYMTVRKGVIILVVVPRIPKTGPAGPCFVDLLTKTFNAKDAKFTRFAQNGVQHLMVKSAKATVEMIALA